MKKIMILHRRSMYLVIRHTQRETQTETDTDRHRQTQTETDRDRQRQTDTDRHRQTDRQRRERSGVKSLTDRVAFAVLKMKKHQKL